MQFLLMAKDRKDDQAIARREAVRAQHIALGEQLLASGNLWYGAALLNDKGEMRGSMLMMDFPSETELNAWLDIEPYVTGKVWDTIEIQKCKTRDPWQFNRPKEFFKGKE